MYDQVFKFEIFSQVNITMALSENEIDDEGFLLDQFYDPRFKHLSSADEMEEYGTEDMRLAMINFLCEEMATEEEPLDLDPHRVVFIQMLSTGRFKNKDIWFSLKLEDIFDEVNDIVVSAYQWRDTAETENEAREIMKALYTAGMLEQRKRDGFECSGCGIP